MKGQGRRAQWGTKEKERERQHEKDQKYGNCGVAASICAHNR